MKSYLKFILSSVILISHCFALDTITAMGTIISEHKQRLTKFTINRQDDTIFDHTKKIYGVLSDESKVSKRHATIDEKKTIFQAIMATRIIDGGIEENNQKVIDNYEHTVVDQALINHFLIIKKVDLISIDLVNRIRITGCESLKNAIKLSYPTFKKNPGLDELSGVSADTFMDWFYESLEQHFDELSFFGGANIGASSTSDKIDRAWFKMVQDNFSMRNVISYDDFNSTKGQAQHIWILNASGGKPVAIYKPKEILNTTEKRNINYEVLSGLIAKAMNIDDVVNCVIPVRVVGDQLTFDPWTPTGTIERYLGFSKSQISDDTKFSRLIRRAFEFSKKNTGNDHNVPEEQRLYRKTYGVLDQKVFKGMFLNENVYQSLAAGTFSEDVETFSKNETINPIDLYKIIAFWYLTDYGDMHEENILFIPNFNNQILKPIVIDCEYTFGSGDKLNKRNTPQIYQLHQAKTPIAYNDMQTILGVNQNKFLNIFKLFGFSLLGQEKLFLERLNMLTGYCNQGQTQGLKIGKLMNLIEKPQPADQSVIIYTGPKKGPFLKKDLTATERIDDFKRITIKQNLDRLYTDPYYSTSKTFPHGLNYVFSCFTLESLDECITTTPEENHLAYTTKQSVRAILSDSTTI